MFPITVRSLGVDRITFVDMEETEVSVASIDGLDEDEIPDCDDFDPDDFANFDTVIFGTQLGETINGTSGDDLLVGGGGGDTIHGLAGEDKLFGCDGQDNLNAGDDNDKIFAGAPTPDGRGYWLVADDGGIFTFGNATFYGSTGAVTLNRPIVGMSPMVDGTGYWLVASDGGIFTFGAAPFYGSAGGMGLTQPVVSLTRSATEVATTS
jgi:Ca2+-binding RTX toxin-like protein